MSQYRSLNIDISVEGKSQRIDSQRRTNFVQKYDLDHLIPNRYTEIFVADLIANLEINKIDPRFIIDEIKRLETLDDIGYTKQASQFKHAPLHPLWHQHYFSEHYIVNNIYNEIKIKNNLKKIYDNSMGELGSAIEQKHIDSFIHNIVDGTIEKRSNEQRITGEWLVFSKEEAGNVYLCMATHTMGDTNIYEKIAYCCERQFPSLEPFFSDRKSS